MRTKKTDIHRTMLLTAVIALVGSFAVEAKIGWEGTNRRVQQAVTELFDFHVSTVTFRRDCKLLGPTNRGKLAGFIEGKKANHPNASQIIIATWSDNHLPREPLVSLARRDQLLALNRSKELRLIVEATLGARAPQHVVELKMTQQPVAGPGRLIADVPQPSIEFELKRAFLAGGKHRDVDIARLSRDLIRLGGPSKAVIIWLPKQKAHETALPIHS